MEKPNPSRFAYSRIPTPSAFIDAEAYCGLLRKTGVDQPRGTLYVLHGGGGDDRQGVDIGLPALFENELSSLVDRDGFQIAFPFVAGSFLNSRSGTPKRNFSRYFFEEVLPLIEKGTSTQASSRILCGFSMGGQAALNAFFRHPEKFSAVGALFPTLVDFDYTDLKEAESFKRRTGIDQKQLEIVLTGFTDEFFGRDDFSKFDPLQLARGQSPENLKGKKIYFDCGSKDDYGLFEGASRLNALLKEKKIDHFHETVQEGKHDVPYILQRFPKMIRYLLN